MRGHDHELDDKLHPGCPMCDEIMRRQPGTKRDRDADALTHRYAAIADRPRDATP